MPRSKHEFVKLTCSNCGKAMMADAWRIVDTQERPDLLTRARQAKLNWATCPACKSRTRIDVVTVFYSPGWGIPVLATLSEPILDEDSPINKELRATLAELEDKLRPKIKLVLSRDLLLIPKTQEPLFLAENLEQLPQEYLSEWQKEYLDALEDDPGYAHFLLTSYSRLMKFGSKDLNPIYTALFWRTLFTGNFNKEQGPDLIEYASLVSDKQSIEFLREHPEYLSEDGDEKMIEILNHLTEMNANFLVGQGWRRWRALEIARTEGLDAASKFLDKLSSLFLDLMPLFWTLDKIETTEKKIQFIDKHPELFGEDAKWLLTQLLQQYFWMEDTKMEATIEKFISLHYIYQEHPGKDSLEKLSHYDEIVMAAVISFFMAEPAEAWHMLETLDILLRASALEAIEQMIEKEASKENASGLMLSELYIYRDILFVAHYEGRDKALVKFLIEMELKEEELEEWAKEKKEEEEEEEKESE
ncbi:MAG: hypothetical protein GXP38_09005 [Chloroflexi bacterium]|nr:hypothetical protein [Chloroflexota bacterium]